MTLLKSSLFTQFGELALELVALSTSLIVCNSFVLCIKLRFRLHPWPILATALHFVEMKCCW